MMLHLIAQRPSIRCALVFVVVFTVTPLLPALGQQEIENPDLSERRIDPLKRAFLSERYQRMLAESRLHALQISASLRH